MFLKVVAIIDIILGIILMIFNTDQILTLFIAICASVALIYFSNLCRDVAKIRFEAEQIHHELVRASEATPEQSKEETKYDGVNHPGPRYEAVLKAERNKQ